MICRSLHDAPKNLCYAFTRSWKGQFKIDLQGSRGVASVAVHVGSSKATCLDRFLRTVIYFFKPKAPT